ncbi:MAG: hypothetical protein AAFR61_30550 [Bacteroidota bacterium]
MLTSNASLTLGQAVPSLATSKDISRLTYRQLYIRKLFSGIKNFRYALFDPISGSMSEIARATAIHLFVDQADLVEWKAMCRYSTYLKSANYRIHAHQVVFSLLFLDESELSLHLHFRMSQKDWVIGEKEVVLSKVHILENGLKLAHPVHAFEYIYISHCMDQAPISEEVQSYFLGLSPETRQEIRKYFWYKYATSAESMEMFFQSVKDYRDKILHALGNHPKNKGLLRLKNVGTYTWDSLVDRLKGTRPLRISR